MAYREQVESAPSFGTPLVYEAVLIQTGTSAPSEGAIGVNSVGESALFLYHGIGEFEIGFVSMVFTDKTMVQTSIVNSAPIDLIKWEIIAENKIKFYCSLNGTPANLGGGAFGVSIWIWP